MLNSALNNCNSDILYLRKFTIIALFIYFVMALVYFLVGYREPVPFYMESSRFMIFVYTTCMLMASYFNVSTKNLFIANALFYLLLVIIIRYSYSHEGLDYFATAIDPYTYLEYAVKFGDEDLAIFLKKLSGIGFYRDDWGYFFVLRMLYKIYPDIYFIIYGAIFLNIIAIYISSIFLYKLQMLLTNSDLLSRVTSVFYSSSAFLVITTANGLKEVIFLTFIIISMFYIYKTKYKFSYSSLFWALFSMSFCLFFRTAVFFMLFISLIIALTINSKNKKIYLIGIISALFLVGVLLPFVVNNLMDADLGQVTKTAEHRISIRGYKGAFYSQIVPLLSAIFGPFPNFDRVGDYAIIHSLTPFMKCFFSSMFVMGLYSIVRYLKEDYVPLVAYIFFSILMTVMSGVSLDMRYHLTYFPFFLMISFNFIKKRKLLDYSYIFMAIGLIYFYSTRNVFGG